jgi:hypothetical protein
MWVYVKDNKYDITSCAGNEGILPSEFELEIDYDKQWNSLYMKVAYQIYNTIKWTFPNIHHEEIVDFDDLFGYND